MIYITYKYHYMIIKIIYIDKNYFIECIIKYIIYIYICKNTKNFCVII